MLANNSPFINKNILKAIMKRTRFKNKFIKYPFKHVKETKEPTMHKETCVFFW